MPDLLSVPVSKIQAIKNTGDFPPHLDMCAVVLLIEETVACASCNINKPFKILSCDTSACCIQLHTVVYAQQSLII